jgi:hypothetical protein
MISSPPPRHAGAVRRTPERGAGAAADPLDVDLEVLLTWDVDDPLSVQ